jgi:ribosomal protein S24E
MEILNENKNDLLRRKEIIASLQVNSNPGFEYSKKHLAEKFKADLDKIAIKSIKNNFGTNEFLIEALIYESTEAKEKIESKPKQKKPGAAA